MIIEKLFHYLNAITVVFAIICALLAFIIKPPQGGKVDLEFVLNRSLSGAAIPTGIALLLCALQPQYLPMLDGANLNIAISGIAIIFISIRGVFKP